MSYATAKSRKVILYTCSNCEKESEWAAGWAAWYKTPGGKLFKKYNDPEPFLFACSPKCIFEILEKYDLGETQ